MNAPQSVQAWRVAALTMMPPEELQRLLQGSEAAVWVEAAASCGMPEAQLLLGRLLLEGQGIAKDTRAAFACFLCAAKSGSADACNMVGRCYENGWGAPQDFARAAKYYRAAAEGGLAWAQYNLGHLLLDGLGVARDRNQAFIWYMRAASSGHERAMNLVARCFEEGWGTERNPAAARNWYRKSAFGGYFRGAYNYASILAAEGCMTGARLWFQRALASAPEPTRTNIRDALAQHPEPQFRALA